ncbi:hypothetical protein GCK32_011322 [Trichostrongylus colubriformis]|uniref:MADF domain-containing protein n=1 Tax=Trichostrongylus colubriformis TaxID=6319 RepID=A0AAN8FRQ6_TRICO
MFFDFKTYQTVYSALISISGRYAYRMPTVPIRTQLIEFIEMEPSIWDTSCAEYANRDRKDAAWERVLTDMESCGHRRPLNDLKAMWKNMKDMYKRKRNQPTGSAGSSEWCYMESLRFLEKNEFSERTLSNVDESGAYRRTMEDPDIEPGSSAASQRSMSPIRQPKPKRRRESGEGGAATQKVQETLARVEERGIQSDRFKCFGDWVASQLRERYDNVQADAKMRVIADVLLGAVVPVEADTIIPVAHSVVVEGHEETEDL